MKRLISALLCIVMLAGLLGCKQNVPSPEGPTPPQTVAPSPGPTQTGTPSPTPDTPPEESELVYSNEELDVKIYSAKKGSEITVEYGGLSQRIEGSFWYNGLRPDYEVWEHDGDGDGTPEVYILHELGSGTGASVFGLLVCEPNGGKLDYWIHDWKPIAEDFNANRVASYNEKTSVVTVSYGRETLSITIIPSENCDDPALIDGNQVGYTKMEDGSIVLFFSLAMTTKNSPMVENFYGISLSVKLDFDGQNINAASDPWLSYNGVVSLLTQSPGKSVTLWEHGDGHLVLQCGNTGGPINYPDDLEYPPFHKDNLDKITLYEPESGGAHPVVLLSAPNAAGEEIFYELRWVEESASWDLSFFDAAKSSDANRLVFFDHLLHNGASENWYLAAIGSIFGTPAEMDLGLIFYNGFSGGEITPQEKAYLLEQGFSEHISMHRLPADKLDEVLNAYFGVSLYDMTIPSDWVYYPETDCYYSSHGDAYLVHGFDVMQVNATDDGLIELHYYVEPLRGAFDPATGWPVVYGILTLQPSGNGSAGPEGYTVVSNRAAQPIDARIEEGVFLYELPNGLLYLQDGYSAGPVTYVNDINANHPGCYDLSLITITRKEFLHDWEGEPLYGVILLNLLSGEPTENVELRWVEKTGTWEVSIRISNQPDLGGEVTKDTIPTDPKQFYRVADSGSFALYARNHGLESLMTWEGNFWWYLGERTAHTGHFNLPVMVPMENPPDGVTDSVAVISEVQTGTQTGVDELIVYQVIHQPQEDGGIYTVLKESLYDWRPVAEQFNKNNTLIYDRESNSLTLLWNGSAYFSGTLSNDLSTHLDLEDGFAGSLIASGQLVRYETNPDGSFTITMQTCVGRGGDGHFSDDISGDPFWYWNGEENYCYGMSAGITGLELSWTVRFTGDGFETSEVSVVGTGTNTAYLRAAIPAEEIYLFRKPGDADGKNYLLIDRNIYEVANALYLGGDQIVDFRHHDLDGDGVKELAVVGNMYAGGGYSSILVILDQTADGWSAQQFWPDGEDYIPPYGADSMNKSATFTVGDDPTEVTLHLLGFDYRFLVSDEVATWDGDYAVWDVGLSRAITWDNNSYYLHLPGFVTRSDVEIDVSFELRCRLDYLPDGTIGLAPVGLMAPYTHFSVTQLTDTFFELGSKNGFVQFEGSHVRGEKIITNRRDLNEDGVEEFIVFLVADNSAGLKEYDVHIFDGKTLTPCDTSDLWDIAFSLFAFTADADHFHIHCGQFSVPLSKADIRALYPGIDLLEKVELWGSHSSVSVMWDYLEVEYSCMVGHNRETFGLLRVHLKVNDNHLVPVYIELLSPSGQVTGQPLVDFTGFKPYISQ